MSQLLKRQAPWLLNGTYYRRLPEGDEQAAAVGLMRGCVVTLHVDSADEEEPGAVRRTPIGAAFAVSLCDDDGREFSYLVSTREVVRRSIRHDSVFLRFALEDGGSVDVATVPYDDWYPHPDPNADVAVHPLADLPPGVDLTPVPLELVIGDETAQHDPVVSGDRLLSVGQFEPPAGAGGPRSVVSSGSVYTAPQIVATRLVGPDAAPIEVDGYLVEWLSWGGASGCPVFRYSESDDVESPVGVIGVMHSHLAADDPQAMGEALDGEGGHGEFEMAVVVPSRRVREVLEDGPLLEARQEAAESRMIERLEREREVAIEALATNVPAG